MSYITALWDRVLLKLGSVASFIPPIAEQIKVAVADGDVAKVRAHTVQFRQFCEKGIALCDGIDDAVADGNINLVEGSQIVLDLESLVDEADDVIKGADD